MDVIQLTVLPLAARAVVVAAVVWGLIAVIRVWRGMDSRTAISRSVSEALIAVGVIVVWGVTLAPVDVLVNGATPRRLPVNLVPVLPILAGLADATRWQEDVPNLVGNLLLFVPIGFGLRWRFGLHMRWILLIGAAGSAAIEVLQALSDEMRAPDVNDVILNAIGAVGGAWAYVALRRMLTGRIEERRGGTYPRGPAERPRDA